MPRIPEKDINYAEVGRWVLDYWSGEKSAAAIEKAIKDRVLRVYADNPSVGAAPQVDVIFEEAGQLKVVVPYNPWSDDPDTFDCVKDLDAYQSELGIVIFGGCR
jgi:hypothetical protein